MLRRAEDFFPTCLTASGQASTLVFKKVYLVSLVRFRLTPPADNLG
jgi:hypothetical protein